VTLLNEALAGTGHFADGSTAVPWNNPMAPFSAVPFSRLDRHGHQQGVAWIDFDRGPSFFEGLGFNPGQGGIVQGAREITQGWVADGVGNVAGGAVQTVGASVGMLGQLMHDGIDWLQNNPLTHNRNPFLKGLGVFLQVLGYILLPVQWLGWLIQHPIGFLFEKAGELGGLIVHGVLWCVIKPFELLVKAITHKKTDQELAAERQQRLDDLRRQRDQIQQQMCQVDASECAATEARATDAATTDAARADRAATIRAATGANPAPAAATAGANANANIDLNLDLEGDVSSDVQ
jgi:hypothetical protein